MSSIFISYSRKDKTFASRLHETLVARSRDVWIDWEDIPPTAEWLAEIEVAIEAADAFLFVISPDSIESKVCAHEIEHAVQTGKRLIPLLWRDTAAERVAPELAKLNWLMFRAGDDFADGVETLLGAVDTDLDWVHTHTRLLVRASEWERKGREDSYLLRGVDLAEAEAWFAEAGPRKDPPPTPLHKEYLLASRQAQTREIERLEGLYRNALARQLAAQAALLKREDDAMLDRAMLLAIESMRRVPNAEADRTLREGLQLRAKEIERWQHSAECTAVAACVTTSCIASCDAEGELLLVDASSQSRSTRLKLPSLAYALAFDERGQRLAAACANGAVVVYDVDSGQWLRTFEHAGRARAVAFAPGRARVAYAGDAGVVLWDLDTGDQLWQRAFPAQVWSLSFAADGRHVAAGASDCVVRLLDADTGAELGTFAHEAQRQVALLERGASDAGIAGLAFTPDGTRLVSGGLDGSVRVWDIQSGAQLRRMDHRREVTALALSRDGRWIASGSMDRTAAVWDLESGALLKLLPHQGVVTALSFGAEDSVVGTAAGDGTARLWRVQDGVEIARCVHGDWVNGLTFFRDRVPVSIGADGRMIAWQQGAPDFKGVRHEMPVKRCVSSPDGRYALVRCDHPTLILYDTEDNFSWRLIQNEEFGDDEFITRDGSIITTDWGGSVRELDLGTLEVRRSYPHGGRVWNSALSPDEALLATAVQDEPLARVWRRTDGILLAELVHEKHIRSLAFSPDGSLLLTATDDGIVRLWEVAAGRERWRRFHTGTAWWVAFDPTGSRCASGGEDGSVFIFDPGDGAVAHELAHGVGVAALAFSPEGRRLAVRTSDIRGGNELDVFLWDAVEGRELARLRHEGTVHHLDWSPDGTLLATASQDKRTRVFEMQQFREIVRLQFAELSVFACFSHGGRRLVSTSYDGTLQFSVVRPEELVELASERVPRTLTDDEWRQYLPGERR